MIGMMTPTPLISVDKSKIPPICPIDMGNDGVFAFFTHRGTYYKDNPYSSFNICDYTGDSIEHVDSCRNLLCRHLGISREKLIVPHQTHSSHCVIIDQIPVDYNKLNGTDAVATKLRGVVIGISTADCIPILLADPCNEIIAATHAGWRGAINGIIQSTIATMVSLGSKPKDIIASMGPAICSRCFEVGDDVASRFPQSCVKNANHAKPHIDLAKYAANQLIASGVEANNIAGPPACTRCNSDKFFSARALGINSGRIFSAIMLKNRDK